MNTLNFGQTIVGFTAVSSVVFSLFAYFIKRLFDSALNKRAESYKAEIELANKKAFHQFGKIFDEQAQNIKMIYSDLAHTSREMDKLAYHYHLLNNNPELLKKGNLIGVRPTRAVAQIVYIKAKVAYYP